MKNKTFSALDIIESLINEMWLVSFVTCVDLILFTIAFEFKLKSRNLVAFTLSTHGYNVHWKILLICSSVSYFYSLQFKVFLT